MLTFHLRKNLTLNLTAKAYNDSTICGYDECYIYNANLLGAFNKSNMVFDIIKKTGVTVLFVTHDTQDALSVADEIMILQNGKVIQKDAAANLYVKPNTLYVASLFGNTVQINKNLQSAFKCPLNENCCHAIRNEKFKVFPAQEGADPKSIDECDYITKAAVLKKVVLGDSIQLLLKLESGEQLSVMTKDTNVADSIYIGFNSKDILEFSEEN